MRFRYSLVNVVYGARQAGCIGKTISWLVGTLSPASCIEFHIAPKFLVCLPLWLRMSPWPGFKLPVREPILGTFRPDRRAGLFLYLFITY